MTPEELEAIMADIASANTRYGKRVDRIRERIRKMRSVIIQQKAQIETLKEMLIQERLKNLEACNGECGKIEDPDCEKCEYEFCRQQLKAEMPEVEWE